MNPGIFKDLLSMMIQAYSHYLYTSLIVYYIAWEKMQNTLTIVLPKFDTDPSKILDTMRQNKIK